MDSEHIGTVSVTPPSNVEATTLNQDQVELSWDEPSNTGGSPVLKYRIFVSEKDR